MSLSIAIILLLGLVADHLLRRIRIPGLIGMLLIGALVGPHWLNFLDPKLLAVADDFRRLALIIILLRAGLQISRAVITRLGRTVLLLSFVPSLLEALAITAVAPRLLGLSVRDAALLGAVLAAVSPAVVVPTMLDFIARGKGKAKSIPTMLLAAAPLDNAFVIVSFAALLDIAQHPEASIPLKLVGIPISIVVGVAVGLVVGKRLYRGFIRFDPRATKRVLIALGVSVVLVSAEGRIQGIVPFSGLMAVMAIAFVLLDKSETVAHEIAAKLAKMWVFAEILLFVLVGAQADIGVALRVGLWGAAVIAIGLCARSVGVLLSLLGTDLTFRERLFCVAAYLPKATVQAAVGATPLAVGIPGGATILAVAILAIFLTAPLGAVATRRVGERVLS